MLVFGSLILFTLHLKSILTCPIHCSPIFQSLASWVRCVDSIESVATASLPALWLRAASRLSAGSKCQRWGSSCVTRRRLTTVMSACHSAWLRRDRLIRGEWQNSAFWLFSCPVCLSLTLANEECEKIVVTIIFLHFYLVIDRHLSAISPDFKSF